MSENLIALIIIALVIALGKLRGSSLFSPLNINAFSWLFAFLPGLIYYDEFYPLTETTFIAWFIWFGLTSICFFFLQPRSLGRIVVNLQFPQQIHFRYYWIVVILALWLSLRIWVVGNVGPNNFFLNLRLSSNGLDEYESLGFIMFFYPVVTGLFIFEQVNYTRNRRAERWVLFFWLILFAVGTMGKFAILAPMFIWVLVAGIQKRVGLGKLLKVVLITLFLMLVAQMVRSDGSSDFDLFKMLGVYTYSPIVAFGYLDNPQSHYFAQYSLRFFYSLGYAIGFAPKPVDVIMDYVQVPALTNVYTVLMPFYLDFSLWGVFFFALLYGVLFGVLYLLVNKSNSLYFAMYVSVAMNLFSQFFAETFFTTLSYSIQVNMVLFFLFCISKRKCKLERTCIS